MAAEDRERYRNPLIFLKEVLKLEVAEFHQDWLGLAQKHRFVCIMAPRGHGKTEVLIIGFMLYKWYMKVLEGNTVKPFEGMIISKTMPQTVEVLRRLKYHIMDSEILKPYLPEGREGKIAQTQLIFKGRHRISCRPYGDAVRGEHVDLCAIDECGTFEDKSYFTYAVMPTVQKKNGQIIAIGTPTSQFDLLSDLFNNTVFKSMKFQAYKDSVRKKPLWPGQFSKEKLEGIKEVIGTLSFSREYMCEPMGEEDRIFKYDLVMRSFLPNEKWVLERRPGDNLYYIGADFAMSTSKGSDYSVFTAVEKSPDGICRICEIQRYKGLPYEHQKAKLIDMYKRFQPMKVLIDSRTFGQTFFQELLDLGMRVEEYIFTNESKKTVMMHLVGQFEKMRILMPRGLDCLAITNQMVKELLSIGVKATPSGNVTFEGIGEHDDCVISLALAIYSATRFSTIPISIKRSGYALSK